MNEKPDCKLLHEALRAFMHFGIRFFFALCLQIMDRLGYKGSIRDFFIDINEDPDNSFSAEVYIFIKFSAYHY